MEVGFQNAEIVNNVASKDYDGNKHDEGELPSSLSTLRSWSSSAAASSSGMVIRVDDEVIKRDKKIQELRGKMSQFKTSEKDRKYESQQKLQSIQIELDKHQTNSAILENQVKEKESQVRNLELELEKQKKLSMKFMRLWKETEKELKEVKEGLDKRRVQENLKEEEREAGGVKTEISYTSTEEVSISNSNSLNSPSIVYSANYLENTWDSEQDLETEVEAKGEPSKYDDNGHIDEHEYNKNNITHKLLSDKVSAGSFNPSASISSGNTSGVKCKTTKSRNRRKNKSRNTHGNDANRGDTNIIMDEGLPASLANFINRVESVINKLSRIFSDLSNYLSVSPYTKFKENAFNLASPVDPEGYISELEGLEVRVLGEQKVVIESLQRTTAFLQDFVSCASSIINLTPATTETVSNDSGSLPAKSSSNASSGNVKLRRLTPQSNHNSRRSNPLSPVAPPTQRRSSMTGVSTNSPMQSSGLHQLSGQRSTLSVSNDTLGSATLINVSPRAASTARVRSQNSQKGHLQVSSTGEGLGSFTSRGLASNGLSITNVSPLPSTVSTHNDKVVDSMPHSLTTSIYPVDSSLPSELTNISGAGPIENSVSISSSHTPHPPKRRVSQMQLRRGSFTNDLSHLNVDRTILPTVSLSPSPQPGVTSSATVSPLLGYASRPESSRSIANPTAINSPSATSNSLLSPNHWTRKPVSPLNSLRPRSLARIRTQSNPAVSAVPNNVDNPASPPSITEIDIRSMIHVLRGGSSVASNLSSPGAGSKLQSLRDIMQFLDQPSASNSNSNSNSSTMMNTNNSMRVKSLPLSESLTSASEVAALWDKNGSEEVQYYQHITHPHQDVSLHQAEEDSPATL